MQTKEDALVSLEVVASEMGRNILQRPIETLLSSYQVGLSGLSGATPINILPNRSTPIDQTSIVMAHNAYNSLSSGAFWPNQRPSITELLDIGVRGLELDVRMDNGIPRLCHELCTPLLLDMGSNRQFSDALSEVSTWLRNHPSELIILKVEDYIPRSTLTTEFSRNLNTSLVFTPDEFTSRFHNTWPSIEQLSSLGKQLILMPQNSGQDPTLYFNGNWGSRFKNPFNTGTISKVRPLNLTIPRSSATQLLEVGEDRTFFGTVADYARRVPLVGGYIPSVAGHMTKEEVQTLRANGVNLISLDDVSTADSRLTSSMTLFDIRNSAYVFIPTAIVLAAVTPRDKGDRLLSTTATRSFMQLLVASTLPDEGRVIYNSVDTGISAYNESYEIATRANRAITTLERVGAVGHALASGLGKGTETVARIGLSNISGQSISGGLAPTTILGTMTQTVTNFIAVKMILDPPLGAVKGAYQELTTSKTNESYWEKGWRVLGGISDGFVRGIESSMFGLVKFTDPNEPDMDASIRDLTDRMSRLSLQNLRRYEKEYMTELFKFNDEGKGFNFKKWLHKESPEHQELLTRLIQEAHSEASEQPKKNEAKENRPLNIEIISESEHIKQHSENIDAVIKKISTEGSLKENTTIALERKQAGNNLGMEDIILLAKIIKYNETSENKINLPEDLKKCPIYHDAVLYNKAKEIEKETGFTVRVVGIEGKGLEHDKDSPKYNQEREAHMKKKIGELSAEGGDVTVVVGKAHAKEISSHVEKLQKERASKVDQTLNK